MNRRDVIVGGIAAVAAVPAIAQLQGATNCRSEGFNIACDPIKAPAERQREYIICKERGHSAANYIVLNVSAMSNVSGVRDDWQTCKYCGTLYRFVTTMEEQNKP